MQRSSVRLYALVAGGTDRAVVLRRGPSRSVLLVSWRTDRDVFTPGQWLRGRVYERRCDLSPDGTKLLYFAASWRKPHGTYTAVSSPPWFRAVALWPKGDAWGGGGLFENNSRILLNHPPSQTALADGFTLPRSVQVAPFGEWPGRGEDEPIWRARLERDGWRRTTEGVPHRRPSGSRIWIEYDPPIVYTKWSPRRADVALEMRIRGVKERQGPWYAVDHALVRAKPERERVFLRSDWADWDRHDDLLLAQDGCVLRLPAKAARAMDPDAEPRCLIDLAPLRFEAVAAPSGADRW